ncbi:MAG TPA: hypothetical protein VGP68_02245 [Gemmataceae bacterium]|jgi:hypothetical protein|nr:hypothetical protein [Gemmataceae bacterium]
MPCSLLDAGLASFTGSIRFKRRFGMPRSHDSQEHYWLLFDARAESMQVVLNDQPLADFAGSGTFSVEATAFLRERNQLDVTIHAASDQDGLTGETALEIRQAAFLQNAKVARRRDGRLEATVEIAGEPPAGLELYLLAERRTLAYWQASTATCQLVKLLSEEPVSPETTEARLELIRGGVVWYGIDCAIG